MAKKNNVNINKRREGFTHLKDKNSDFPSFSGVILNKIPLPIGYMKLMYVNVIYIFFPDTKREVL